MIKSLFESDEPQPPPQETESQQAPPKSEKTENEAEDSIRRELEQMNLAHETAAGQQAPGFGPDAEPETKQSGSQIIIEIPPDENILEIPVIAENQVEVPPHTVLETNTPAEADKEKKTPELFQAAEPAREKEMPELFQAHQKPVGSSLINAETLRQSGLAWSAAIGLFGSVVFMLILGWFLDLLTGASPLFIVLGIIIGAAIGFYQFYRTTSQIFKNDGNG